jgi:flavin reductase (DIM6/NTAB) family NADH-FMN oxidoreductase RutF
MFFRPGEHKDHGLPHNPFKSLVVPRPIGWITSLAGDGTLNLAPFSYFNAVGDDPPIVLFAPSGRQRDDWIKDTLRNVEETGEFVTNMATWDLRDEMNRTSAMVGPEVDEAAEAGLEMIPSQMVKPPRVAASPVHMECKYLKTVEFPTNKPEARCYVCFGEVVGIHIDDSVINEKGLVDITRFKPIARLGYMEYAVVDEVFVMHRPE